MGRRGNCWGNAPTEKFWDRLRAASVHGHKFANREQATQPVMDWMDPYNNCRLHSALGCFSLVQFDKHGCEAQRKKAAQSSGHELHETRARSLFIQNASWKNRVNRPWTMVFWHLLALRGRG